MIERIKISDIDKESVLLHACPKDTAFKNLDFSGIVVNKPWGYEYLMFQNSEVSIWVLYIKKGYSTSTHCHPNKKTSLLVLSGEGVCSTLKQNFNLKEKDGLIFEKGVFHTTEAISENGLFVMETETPVDKTDLFRLKDRYKREMKGYSSRNNITNKTYNYHYQFIEDKEENDKIFGKYKVLLKEYKNTEALLNDLKIMKPDGGILISGKVYLKEETLIPADLIEVNRLKDFEITPKTKILFLHERKNLIKLSDFVVSFLQKKGIEKVFLISGGNIMHLTESIRAKKMDYLCNLHEQAAAMAAEAYARTTGKTGFALVTSGPGATNAITGMIGAWIDSTPLLVISGQSYDTQIIGNSGLRQLGVQEINILDIVKPVTKYAVMVKDPKKIRYYLEKALYLANSERPGPVWIDIPVNIQMKMIDEKELESFIPQKKEDFDNRELREKVSSVIKILNEAKRPIVLLGNGVRLGKAEKEFFELAERLSIPILTTRNANDMIWESHELYVGRPGSFGQRHANFAIQNCDVLLSIGSRIGLAVTGWAFEDFARGAKKIVVDIDPAELKKFTIKPYLPINSDAKNFISEMISQLRDYQPKDISEWKEKIKYWKRKYPIILQEYKDIKDCVNTYYFLDILSDELKDDDIIVTDMGMSFQCTMQAMKLKKGQKLFTSSGLAPMGYGLPGAIGACIGNNKKRVICISGDGGLQMNIQELQTLVHYKLPIKLFIFNNKGYSSQRETQKAYFEGYLGSEASSGVSMPDSVKVGEAYGIKSKRIENQKRLKEEIREVLDYPGPYICDINISENQLVIPKQGAFNRPDGKTVPRPIEDMLPYLDREELEKEMIIEPIPFDPYKEENGKN